MNKAARRGLVAVATVATATALVGPTRVAGPWLALVFGLTAAAIVLIRQPGDVTCGRGSVRPSPWRGSVRPSPWVLLAIGMAVASASPLVEHRLAGPGVFTAPFGVTIYAVSAAFAVLGLLGLLRDRAPGHAFVLMVGECLIPLALAFLVWVTALQMPPVAGFGSLPVTLAIAAVAGGLCFVSVAGLLIRFDDEERSVFALACAAFWLISASTGLEAIRSWLGGTIDPRWAVATAVGGLGVWLVASAHPAMGSGIPAGSTIPGGLGDRRRFIVAALVLMTGPVLIVEYAERGSIRKPVWMAGGTAVVLALVTSYLLRLAGRAGRLEQLAQRDQLTGVALRTLFVDRLGQALARGRRDGTGVAVLFVDLDRFKQINDSLGHAAGNDVLRFAAQRLERVVGRNGSALVGRIGGDEFAAFVSDLEPHDDAVSLCAAIVDAFEHPFTTQRHDVFVTASVGAARFPDAGNDADTLLRNADAAMYKAKRRGRDAYEIYRPDNDRRARDRVSLESQLHSAIERGELRLHFQPKVGLRDGTIVGVEALLRWEHPKDGLLLPGAFIHLAEESGLIVRLDEWALEQACTQATEWQRSGFGSLSVAVNLSARDFRHRKVEDMVAAVLRRTGLDPRSLELELTESLAKDDPARTRATLLDLKEMGVHSSIDDFGTGYSSLSSLASLPIDRLKIDKSFVEHLADGRQYALITSVIALGHGLDLEVTAEGVETVRQMEFLQAHGCDVMQGYLFSPPLPADQLERLFMIEHVASAPGRLQLLGGDWLSPALPLPDAQLDLSKARLTAAPVTEAPSTTTPVSAASVMAGSGEPTT